MFFDESFKDLVGGNYHSAFEPPVRYFAWNVQIKIENLCDFRNEKNSIDQNQSLYSFRNVLNRVWKTSEKRIFQI